MQETNIRLAYKQVDKKIITAGGSVADENLTKCERLSSEEHKITFNWFTSYEGYLAHHEEALRKKEHPPCFFICHEFFDALPVMIFEKTGTGWVEKLVDNNIDVASQ